YPRSLSRSHHPWDRTHLACDPSFSVEYIVTDQICSRNECPLIQPLAREASLLPRHLNTASERHIKVAYSLIKNTYLIEARNCGRDRGSSFCISDSLMRHNRYFWMNADKTEAASVSSPARKGRLGAAHPGLLASDLLKPVAIIIVDKLLKPGG